MPKRATGIPPEQSTILKKTTTTATDKALHHLAFNTSIVANIITTASTGKIIIVNHAACKLLGYSKKELLTKLGSAIFDVSHDSFKKMLKQRSANGNATAIITVIKSGGKRLPCEITSSLFVDSIGIKRALYTIADVSLRISKQKDLDAEKEKLFLEEKKLALANSNARLAQNNEWIKYIARTSYDVMWDWDIYSGEIYVGDSIREVFGYKPEMNATNFTDFKICLLQNEKEAVLGKLSKALASNKSAWSDSFMFTRSNGTVASTASRACIVRDDTGKAIRLIGAIQDVSILQKLKKQLEDQDAIKKENNQIFHLAAKLSYDCIWDWNMKTNEFFLGEGCVQLFGYNFNKKYGYSFDWRNYLHPADKVKVQKDLQKIIISPANDWESNYRIMKADGSVAEVLGRGTIIRDATGTACRMIGVIHDLSHQKQLEQELELEIKLKKKQIAEAEEEARETERSDIGKELHDNVNQLLGASRLYLDMAKRGDDKWEMFLSRCSQYTQTAIEEIRKLTKGLTTDAIKNLGLCEAIDNVARDMMEVHHMKISCALQTFREQSVDDKFKLTVFRIVQEQLNNILSHAKATQVYIGLSQNKESIILSVIDNGVGFDTNKKSKGIGIRNIISRVNLYRASLTISSQPGEGCSLVVDFPFKNARRPVKH